MDETYSRKRYVTICAGCQGVFACRRKDQVTCSPKCRVNAHRSGEMKRLQRFADSFEVTVSSMQRAAAVRALRPDLADQIFARKMTEEEAGPAVLEAYRRLLLGQAAA
jgi:hypothetical protein